MSLHLLLVQLLKTSRKINLYCLCFSQLSLSPTASFDIKRSKANPPYLVPVHTVIKVQADPLVYLFERSPSWPKKGPYCLPNLFPHIYFLGCPSKQLSPVHILYACLKTTPPAKSQIMYCYTFPEYSCLVPCVSALVGPADATR